MFIVKVWCNDLCVGGTSLMVQECNIYWTDTDLLHSKFVIYILLCLNSMLYKTNKSKSAFHVGLFGSLIGRLP